VTEREIFALLYHCSNYTEIKEEGYKASVKETNRRGINKPRSKDRERRENKEH
jgi:hypothetical protein